MSFRSWILSVVIASAPLGGAEILALPAQAGGVGSDQQVADHTAGELDDLERLRLRIAELTTELERLREELDGDAAAVEGAAGEPAKTAEQQSEDQDLEELRRQIEILSEEIERLRSGEAEAEISADEARDLGLAPSAARLYGRSRGVSIAGYGEMLYENFASEDESGNPTGGGAQADFLRNILYVGYRFNDKFLFNSEIEVEHADEIFVEFAYVDYLVSDNLSIRGGMLLIPMGLVNEFHEPTVFLGARRPVTESVIIPSTWRENGFGVVGTLGDKLAYRAYVVNGLEGANFSSGGLRGGRQKGSKAKASDLAVVGRLDYTPTPGVFVGGSLYTGGSGQGDVVVDDREFSVGTTIWELHGQAQLRGFDVRALFARAELDDVARLNELLGLGGGSGVGESLEGGYLQIGYDVLSQTSSGDVALTPYYRFEKVDTQASMPDGFARSLATDATFHTFGIELEPNPGIVLKADYQVISNAAGTGRNQFNINLGYAF